MDGCHGDVESVVLRLGWDLSSLKQLSLQRVRLPIANHTDTAHHFTCSANIPAASALSGSANKVPCMECTTKARSVSTAARDSTPSATTSAPKCVARLATASMTAWRFRSVWQESTK